VPPAGQSVRPWACAAWQCPAQFVPANTKTRLIATADSLLHLSCEWPSQQSVEHGQLQTAHAGMWAALQALHNMRL
jgi:hypothetical protein